jgi:hypothetical protein
MRILYITAPGCQYLHQHYKGPESLGSGPLFTKGGILLRIFPVF